MRVERSIVILRKALPPKFAFSCSLFVSPHHVTYRGEHCVLAQRINLYQSMDSNPSPNSVKIDNFCDHCKPLQPSRNNRLINKMADHNSPLRLEFSSEKYH